MTSRAEQLIKQFDRLYDQQRVWHPLWTEIASYILPRKINVLTTRTPGTKQTEKLFDSTGIHANEVLAASIHGALTNPVVKWFSLRMREKTLNDIQEVAEWLEECSLRIFLAIQNSNFGTQVNEVYLDLGAFGIGALLHEEREIVLPTFNGFVFRSLTIGEYVIEEDAEGFVDTLFRKYTLPARHVVSKWNTASQKTKDIATKEPERPIHLLHVVLPRNAAKITKASKEKPFASFFIEYDAKIKLSEGGYDEFPYMVPRWATTSGEIYGRSPGFTALPDIKTLNRAKEFDLKSWAKKIDPPLQTLDDGVIGTVKLTPGGQTVVRQLDAIKPIDLGGDHRVNMLEANDLRGSIRQIFFNDQLQLPDKTIITATEVERRLELMQRVLGPTVGRLDSELLAPTITRAFGLMYRHGALPPVPDAVLLAAQQQQGDIDVISEGPLSRAQRGSELLAVQRFYELAVPLAQIRPEVLDNVNDDEVLRDIAKQAGLPARFLRGQDDVAQIRESRRQAQEAAKKEATAMQAVEGAGKLAPLLKTIQEVASNE